MGRSESLGITRHISDRMLSLTILAYESMSSRSKTDDRVLRSLKFVQLRYQGMSVAAAADELGISRKTGYNIQEAWNDGGLGGIIPRFTSGPEPRLTEDEMSEIEAHLRNHPMDASMLRVHIRERYGVDYTEKHLRKLFLSRGLRYSRELR